MASCEQTLEAREIVGGTAVVWVGAWDEDVWGFGDVGMCGIGTEFEETGVVREGCWERLWERRKKNMRGKGASGKRASRGGGDGLASAGGRFCLPSREGRVNERQQNREKGRT